ncbi:hypothetical protein [Pseudomonas sp. 31 E 6]|nr:hypothetical protein [Pseudomonas sp. 31 E 5]CRM74757.1 hypothetical protein [Pseudomonas sp. 31 E 6]
MVFAFAGVVQASEVAGFVVVVVALVEVVFLLRDAVGVQAVLVVVVVVAEQLTLLALVLLAGFEKVGSQQCAVQLNGGELAAFGMVEGQSIVVRQAQVLQLTADVVAITQGAPALMLGGQAVLCVVLVGQRPVAVVDAEEVALAVVGVINGIAVGQGFS